MRGAAILLAAGVLAAAPDARAQALGVHPVAGLYGLDATPCGRPAGASPTQDTAYVSPELCFAVTPGRRAALGERFRQRVTARFPGVVADLSTAAGEGTTREAGITRTAVATLHMTRLDFWRVPNRSTIDALVPIGLTLMISDVGTGEVLFTESLTGLIRGTMARGDDRRQVSAQIDAQLEAAVDSLVDAAAARFQPRAVTARVRGRAGDRFVIDQGRAAGLREGDFLDGDVRVVHADATYAVVEPLLGGLTIGQTLSRQVAQPTEALARPAMMVVVAEAPERIGRRQLAAMMEQALGAETPFSAAPVNPGFVEIRDQALGQSGVAHRPRALPDYFLRVTAIVLPSASMSSNADGVPIRMHQARVLVEVIDLSGRVVFAGEGVERYRAGAVEDASLSAEQRDDVALTVAVRRAAEAVGEGFRPQRTRLPVTAAPGGVRIADPGGALTPGVPAEVLRRVGRMSGIEGEVWAPVTAVEVVAVDATGADARFADVGTPAIRSGDQIAWDAPVRAATSRRWFVQCAGAGGAPSISVRGSVNQPGFQPIALNAFAGGFRAPVRIAGFERELRPLLAGQFGDLEHLGALAAPAEDICFEPVHGVEPRGGDRARRALTLSDYDLTVGYTLRRGGERVAGLGRQQVLSGVAVSADADAATREKVLQQSLAEAVSDLARQAAAEIDPPL